MFARHRRFGIVLTFGAVGADLALAGAAGAHNQSAASGAPGGGYGSLGPALRFSFTDYAILYAIVAAPVMAVGIQQSIAFGPQHEAKVIANFQACHCLPAKVSRRLSKYLARR